MNKRVLACVAVICSMSAFADEKIEQAIDDVMRFSCLADRATAHSVPEFGVPDELLVEPSFTSLVEIVRSRINGIDVPFACGITNDVRRAVFIAALAECGDAVYTNAVVRWFGGDAPAPVSAKWMERYAFPAATRMEGFFSVHYDDPAVKKVWENIKTVYLASNDTENAAWVDRVLDGRRKASIEMTQMFEKEGKGKK